MLQYGIITTFATLVGIPSTLAGGAIAGKHSIKKISIIASWIGPAVILGYYFSNSWTTLSVPILLGATGAIGSTAGRQLVADTTMHKSRTAQISLYQTLTAIPSMFSPLLGGYLVHTMGAVEGFRYGAVIALAVSPVSTILLAKFLREKNPAMQEGGQVSAPEQKSSAGLAESISRYPRDFVSSLARLPSALVPLLSAYVIVILANSTTGPYLIFYATSIARLDSFQWGIILSLQILFANLIRTPLGLVSDRFDKKKVLLISVIATAPLSTLLALEHSFLGILVVLVAMTATGISYGPTHEALQIEMTPRERRPALFAMFDVLRSLATSAGTLLGGVLFTLSYALPFYCYTALEVAAGAIIACAFFARSGRYRTVAAPQ